MFEEPGWAELLGFGGILGILGAAQVVVLVLCFPKGLNAFGGVNGPRNRDGSGFGSRRSGTVGNITWANCCLWLLASNILQVGCIQFSCLSSFPYSYQEVLKELFRKANNTLIPVEFDAGFPAFFCPPRKHGPFSDT